MAFRIGKTPETLDVRAKFTDREGRTQHINGTCTFRTSAQYAEWQDGLIESRQADQGSGDLSVTEFERRRTEDRFAQILDSWQSWDLQEPLNLESLQALQAFAPAAVLAMCQAYTAACMEGARGN